MRLPVASAGCTEAADSGLLSVWRRRMSGLGLRKPWALSSLVVEFPELRIPPCRLLGGPSETTIETRHVYSSRPTALRASRCVPNHSTPTMDPFRKVQTHAPRCSNVAPLPLPRPKVRL